MMFLSEIRMLPESERAATYAQWLQDPGGYGHQDTLQNRISAGVGLTEDEQADLAALLGKHCRAPMRARLAHKVACVPDVLSHSRFGRLHHDPKHGWSYSAGQDYPAELREVRELLANA